MTSVTPAREDTLLLSLRALSDDQLVSRLKGLSARERRATAVLVAHLAEMDTRDAHLRAGYSSLFAFCCDVLALSEHEAFNRIEAARAARRFPLVLNLLASGEVTLTTVRLLAPHLTEENHRRVLESARRKKKGEVERIVASLMPRPDIPASVRRLPRPNAAATGRLPESPGEVPPGVPGGVLGEAPGSVLGGVTREVPSPGPVSLDPAAHRPTPGEASPAAAPSEVPTIGRAFVGPRSSVSPLSPDRYRYQLTIGAATLEKLRFAKDLLRHVLPSGDDEAVLDRALSALITDVVRRKVGADLSARSSADGKSLAEKTAARADPSSRSSVDGKSSSEEAAGSSVGPPAGPEGSPRQDSRGIPAAVKRAVWVRDLGRCAFVAADGRRCGERSFVEFHHLKPYAVGGRPTVDNIQLRCRSHNGYEARVFFARGADEVAPHCAAGAPRPDWSWSRTDHAGRSGTSAPERGVVHGPGLAVALRPRPLQPPAEHGSAVQSPAEHGPSAGPSERDELRGGRAQPDCTEPARRAHGFASRCRTHGRQRTSTVSPPQLGQPFVEDRRWGPSPEESDERGGS